MVAREADVDGCPGCVELAEMVAQLQQELAGLVTAMASRAVIEQAKGIIMATRACTDDDAFAALVRMSQHDNVKLRNLAAQIVADARERYLPYEE